jgi:hypothetical protein
MNEDIASHQKKGESYLAGRELWEKVPDCAYDGPSTASVLANQRSSVIALGAWIVASIALTIFSTRNLTVS